MGRENLSDSWGGWSECGPGDLTGWQGLGAASGLAWSGALTASLVREGPEIYDSTIYKN